MKFERLGDKVIQIRGISFNPKDISGKPLPDYVPILKANNIKESGIDKSDMIYIHKSKVKLEQFIKKGDLLLASSSGSKDIVGKNIFFETDFEGSFGAFCKLVRPKENIQPKFVGVFFKTPYFKRHIRKLINGALINNLKNEHIDSLLIPTLSTTDQLHIANLLSKAENLIRQRKESIALLDEFLKSTFLEMFGDCATNKKNWKKVELKYFGEIITGNTPPRNNAENYSSNFIEWIKTDNIPSEDIYLSSAVEYLSELGLKHARTVEKGALLVACIAGSIQSVGRAALTNRRVSFNQQINAIQPNEDIEPLYLYWLFKVSRKYVQDAASNGMKKILTKGGFEKIKMIKPPIELQTQFAQIAEKTEALKTQYQQSLQELENLYGVLSQKAFKGELKISTEELQLKI